MREKFLFCHSFKEALTDIAPNRDFGVSYSLIYKKRRDRHEDLSLFALYLLFEFFELITSTLDQSAEFVQMLDTIFRSNLAPSKVPWILQKCKDLDKFLVIFKLRVHSFYVLLILLHEYAVGIKARLNFFRKFCYCFWIVWVFLLKR